MVTLALMLAACGGGKSKPNAASSQNTRTAEHAACTTMCKCMALAYAGKALTSAQAFTCANDCVAKQSLPDRSPTCIDCFASAQDCGSADEGCEAACPGMREGRRSSDE